MSQAIPQVGLDPEGAPSDPRLVFAPGPIRDRNVHLTADAFGVGWPTINAMSAQLYMKLNDPARSCISRESAVWGASGRSPLSRSRLGGLSQNCARSYRVRFSHLRGRE